MKLSCFLAFFLLWVVNSFRTSATVPDSLLTERTIRSIYVNYPDSALRLLDEAEKSPASGIIPFRIDLLRAMCYEIKHDLTAKEICVRRALQNDSIRLVPERKLSSITMLANILERQNRYEESIGVCHEGIDLARNLACKKEESDMYSVMARVCIGMTNDEMAQEYFQRAVKLLEGTDDTDLILYAYDATGENCLWQGTGAETSVADYRFGGELIGLEARPEYTSYEVPEIFALS